MRCASIFFVLMSFTIASRGLAEHTVLNGGGQGEQNITFSLVNFEKFAFMCKAVATCAVDEADREALADIAAHVGEVVDQADFINFKTPEQDDRLIDQAGNSLSFLTAPVWGSPVIINRNALYRPAAGSGVTPIPLSDALHIVAEILLRQRHTLPIDRIILLSSRMARLAGSALEEVVIGHGKVWLQTDKLLRFSAWKFARSTLDGYFSEVAIQDADATHVVTNEIAKAVRCPERFHHRPEQMLVRGLSIAQESGNIQAEVRAEVIFTCESGDQAGIFKRNLGRLKIISSFTAEAQSPQSYILSSLSIQVE